MMNDEIKALEEGEQLLKYPDKGDLGSSWVVAGQFIACLS